VSGAPSTNQNYTASTTSVNTIARDTTILLGRHYVQALEASQHNTPRFYGFAAANPTMLEVELEM
jgi:hypothetical protein